MTYLITFITLLTSATSAIAGDITATLGFAERRALDSTDAPPPRFLLLQKAAGQEAGGSSKFVVKDSAATARMSILSSGNIGIGMGELVNGEGESFNKKGQDEIHPALLSGYLMDRHSPPKNSFKNVFNVSGDDVCGVLDRDKII